MKLALVLSLAILAAFPAAAAEELPRKERLRLAAEAKTLMDQKNFAGAAVFLEQATAPGAAAKDLAAWSTALGRCHENLGNYQKAIAAYQEALRLKPRHIDSMLDLARVYDRVDLYSEAIDLYLNVLKREKNRQDVLYALANLYLRAGQLNEARSFAEKSLLAQPQDFSNQALMARIEEAQGEQWAAAHRWEGILANKPDAGGYLQLGKLWARQGQFDLAEVSLGKAGKLGLAGAELKFYQGLVEWYKGKNREAADLWKEALRKDPGYLLPEFFLAVQEFRDGKASASPRLRQAREKTTSPTLRSLLDFLLKKENGQKTDG